MSPCPGSVCSHGVKSGSLHISLCGQPIITDAGVIRTLGITRGREHEGHGYSHPT